MSSVPFPPCVMLVSYATCAPESYTATRQLFVCYGDGALGKPFSKQRLTHWLCEGISHAYELADFRPPEPSERTPPIFGGSAL